jgi:hypothetical protein
LGAGLKAVAIGDIQGCAAAFGARGSKPTLIETK